jgi:tetratricopeptide (TPR) repeat protein
MTQSPGALLGNYRAGEAHMKLRQFAEAVRSFEHALALAESQNESGIAAEINEALGNAVEAKRLAEDILEAQEDFLAASQVTVLCA